MGGQLEQALRRCLADRVDAGWRGPTDDAGAAPSARLSGIAGEVIGRARRVRRRRGALALASVVLATASVTGVVAQVVMPGPSDTHLSVTFDTSGDAGVVDRPPALAAPGVVVGSVLPDNLSADPVPDHAIAPVLEGEPGVGPGSQVLTGMDAVMVNHARARVV